MGARLSHEFAWQFYAGLADLATRGRGSRRLSPKLELATRFDDRAAGPAELAPELARWEDDGGAACP
jgi:hypothetical protein